MQQKPQYYRAGEKIITAGSLEHRMYIILEGSVKITLEEGHDAIQVAVLRKGDFFGEISLFTNTPRSANVIALESVKVVYVDNVDQLQMFLLKNPRFAAKMVHILAKRLTKTNELLIGKVSEINRIKDLHHI